MKNIFPSYEVCLKLKEIGFQEECLAWYVSKDFGLSIGGVNQDDLIRDGVLAPSFGQVFSWLEKEYGFYVSIGVDRTTYPKWAFEISYFFGNPRDLTSEEWGWEEKFHSDLYRTKEECEVDALNKIIDILSN